LKIRSITYFCNPGWPLQERELRKAGMFLGEARSACQSAGYEVQTVRLASVPFGELLGTHLGELPQLARELGDALPAIGAEYAALGPALPDSPKAYESIPDAIAGSKNVFFSGVMAARETGVSSAAARACAEVIVRCAPIEADGFANLRFAALANVPPGSPFFPAAYHAGDQPAFAIAVEAADLAVRAFSDAQSVDEGRDALVHAIEEHGRRLTGLTDLLKYRFGARFGGIDFSLAPFPKETQSLGAAFERMGVPRVGLHGSLAAAAVLTETIERAEFPRAGFSGLMLPVLEDAVLARRAAEGSLTVRDLLLYSAVCGTGLDTVPLPGDTSAGQIAALLLDLSALALRLNKPLTARLMPVPGKQAGDPTGFDFAFFANSRVMRLAAEPLTGALGDGPPFQLEPRH